MDRVMRPLMPALAQWSELGETSQYATHLTFELDDHLARERNQEP